ncbi:zinc finger CCCH domain-containing protein 13 [Artemisia annua]|uniref:Zinc finger CCCH domain-containing protein 13 n=1 Tax=Artemisia annua TaxID=35608 RepID=A0A2U1MP78_ARTAN|nr:zinc finger CCCH domain-containing protein 13 [Artemisia annua]
MKTAFVNIHKDMKLQERSLLFLINCHQDKGTAKFEQWKDLKNEIYCLCRVLTRDATFFKVEFECWMLWANPPGVTNVEIYRLIKERQCGTFRQVAFSFFGIFVVTEEIPEFFEGVEVTEEETDYVETSTATISPLVTATVEVKNSLNWTKMGIHVVLLFKRFRSSESIDDLNLTYFISYIPVLMHTGFCRPTASPPPSAIQELRATVRVLPPQIIDHLGITKELTLNCYYGNLCEWATTMEYGNV